MLEKEAIKIVVGKEGLAGESLLDSKNKSVEMSVLVNKNSWLGGVCWPNTNYNRVVNCVDHIHTFGKRVN